MRKYVILYNALASNGTGREKAEKLKDTIKGELSFEDITKIKDIKAYLDSLPGDLLPVLAGGDGTLNRFVNTVDTDHLTRDLYFCPLGTGNDFMNDVKEKEKEVPFVVNPYLKDLPIVTVKGKDYKVLNGVGYGIAGYCCEVGDALRKKSDKPVNYTGIAIKGLLFHYKPTNATVICDGKKMTCGKVWEAPCMNGRFYGGGMMATPDQDRLNKEGTISSMIFYNAGKLRTLMAFPKIFTGEHVKITKQVLILHGKKITVQFDRPVALQIDGETIPGVTEYTMRSVK